MNTEKKEYLVKTLEQLESEIKPLRDELNALLQAEADTVEERIKKTRIMQDRFKDEELVYAAEARCECGAGFAYPIGSGMFGKWVCSDILTGRAMAKDELGAKMHSGDLHFAFYEIKSENQPSAKGHTTRP